MFDRSNSNPIFELVKNPNPSHVKKASSPSPQNLFFRSVIRNVNCLKSTRSCVIKFKRIKS
jgi:hypothetical protein